MAVELAAKAILAEINPCLIADPRHLESMLTLSGYGSTGLRALRTVGCMDALKRMARILPTVRVTELEPLAEARNGALHLIGADSDAAFKLLVPYIDAMRIMAERLKVPFESSLVSILSWLE